MPSAYADLVPLAEPLVLDIPGPSPAGTSARFEPVFEALAEQVAQLELPAGRPVDWALVVRQAEGLLKERSKDLLVAAYLAKGLQEREGLEGLLKGLVCLTELSRRYWPTMQPDVARPRGRANALTWLLEKSTQVLGPETRGAADLALVEKVEAAAGALSELAREKLGQAAPAFGPLLQALERLKLDAAPPPLPPPVAAPSAPAPATAAPAASGGGVAIAGFDGSPEYLGRAGDALVDAARALREGAPASPAPYRLLRAGLWLHLDAPPAATAGRTSIPPPSPALLQKLELMERSQSWAALLEECESALPGSRFALELHRLAWVALGGLGPDYARARAALLAEVRGFLTRLPEVAGLAFADGSPLAGAATRSWLDEVVTPSGAGPARPAAGAGEGQGDAASEAALAEARTLLAEGRVEAAFARVDQALAALQGGRARFLLRLQAAQACAAAGLHLVARSQFEALEQEATLHGLERFEPRLLVEALRGLVKSARAVQKDPRGATPRLPELFQRLCALDPVAATEAWP